VVVDVQVLGFGFGGVPVGVWGRCGLGCICRWRWGLVVGSDVVVVEVMGEVMGAGRYEWMLVLVELGAPLEAGDLGCPGPGGCCRSGG
jgi:hypothetical protein